MSEDSDLLGGRGILVRAELSALGREATSFIEVACAQPELPPTLWVDWCDPSGHPQPVLPFSWGRVTLPSDLLLLQLSASLRSDFAPPELQFPAPLAGGVLIVNLHTAFVIKAFLADQGRAWPSPERLRELDAIWSGQLPRPPELLPDAALVALFQRRLSDPSDGGIAWLRQYGLPFVVVPLATQEPALPLDELRELFALDPQVPVVPVALTLDQQARDQLKFPFQPADVERVLAELVALL